MSFRNTSVCILIFLLIFPVSSRAASDLLREMQALWPLDEASGNRSDRHAANTLTDNATVTQAAGRGKSAVAGQFTAANSEFLSVPDNTALSMGDVNMSIAVWVRLDTLPSNASYYIASKQGALGEYEYALLLSDSAGTTRFRGGVRDVADTTTTTVNASTFGTPSVDTWYLIVFRHDSTNNRIEISVNDGTFDTTATSGGIRDGADALMIGSEVGTGRFNGKISKLGIWKKVLVAQEVTDLYNKGKGNLYDGTAFLVDTGSTLTTSLTAWWELDELCCTRFDKVSPGAGPAAQFTAANLEYLSKTDNADLSTGDIDFSFSVWVYLDSKGADRFIAAKQSSATVVEWDLYFDNAADRFKFLLQDSGGNTVCTATATTLGSPSTATWYFILAWHDATANQCTIQVNNGTANTASETGVPSDTTALFQISGYNGGTSVWDGRIQNVGFWKRVLTSAEITSLYNSGSGRHCKDLNDQLRRKLISYWNLNEGFGARYCCVGANDLTDNNTAPQATGVAGGNSLGDNATVTHNRGLPFFDKFPGAAQFTAANSEYLSITDNADLSTGTGVSFTIGAWVYRDSIGQRMVITKRDTGQFEYMLVGGSTGDNYVTLQISSDGAGAACEVVSASTLVVNTWYFVVTWLDTSAQEIGMSVDNGAANTAACTASARDGTAPLEIGWMANGTALQYWNGRIQNVGFWKKALSASERTSLYNSGKGLSYAQLSGSLLTSLNAYWDLNETGGTRLDKYDDNHLTDNATVTQAVGVDASAAGQFTAANSEYLSIPDNAALSTGDIDFTVGSWMYADSFGVARALISKWASGNEDQAEYVIRFDGVDRFRSIVGNGATFGTAIGSNAGSPIAGIWYSILGWHDSIQDVVCISVNGGSPNCSPWTGGGQNNTAAMELGRAATGSLMDGRIDQPFFIKRVLTERERARIWNEGKGLSYEEMQRITGGFVE